jgi:hypothetical protein
MADGGTDEKPGSIAPWLVVAGALGLGLVLVGGAFVARPYLASGEGAVPEDATNAIGALPKQLGDKEITATVEHNRAFLRTKCWQPALDSRSRPGSAKARVEASLTIAPTGLVEKVDTIADESFPGLSQCIGDAVKQWKFPRARNQTTIDVPFVFAGQ